MPDGQGEIVGEFEAGFLAAARRLVEYAVIAPGTKVVAVDEEQVGGLLEAMAEMVGLKLIAPEGRQRPKARLHEPVNTVRRARVSQKRLQ